MELDERERIIEAWNIGKVVYLTEIDGDRVLAGGNYVAYAGKGGGGHHMFVLSQNNRVNGKASILYHSASLTEIVDINNTEDGTRISSRGMSDGCDSDFVNYDALFRAFELGKANFAAAKTGRLENK